MVREEEVPTGSAVREGFLRKGGLKRGWTGEGKGKGIPGRQICLSKSEEAGLRLVSMSPGTPSRKAALPPCTQSLLFLWVFRKD